MLPFEEDHFVVGIKKLHPNAVEPTRSHATDAGLDLAAVDKYVLEPGDNYLIRTGLALDLPRDMMGLVYSRSGLPARHKVAVLNGVGVIDPGYTGEVLVNLINHGEEAYTVEAGDRVAQLIFQMVLSPTVFWTEKIEETARGAAGHGSSGR